MPVIGERYRISLERIMVTTDFSPAANLAVRYAAALARRFDATLDLVNVLDLGMNGSDIGGGAMPLDRIAHGNAEELRHQARQLEGVRMEEALLTSFSVVDAILIHANETNPQLIVLATASKHGLGKLVLGSTAEQIFRRASVPVLTVGPKAKEPEATGFHFRNIVYAASHSEESRKAATFAYAFAQDSGAHVYVAHVIPESEQPHENSEEQAKQALERLVPPGVTDWCTPECVIEHGNAPEAILAIAERVNADLIVLGPREESFALKYLKTGMTPQVLAAASCPVMTVR
ncbi:universal stress protein [Terriglobus sp. RCC_193]|uniref:universal stress protein n=1 Tax=Terriglobus sp. RCC_193 TaxID=3239218 RepID=UPI003526BA7C